MGEIYNLNESELSIWRTKILKCLAVYKNSKSISDLALFLIWLYEFVEAYSVNGTGQQAKLKHAKMLFEGSVVKVLFKFRGQLVHKPYTLTEDSIVTFYKLNKGDIERLMTHCGFASLETLTAF